MWSREDEVSVKMNAHDAAIPEVETVRILALLVNSKGANAAMTTEPRTVCEQVMHTITRITKKRGMIEKE